MKLMVVELIINISTGHYIESLRQVLNNIFRSKKEIKEVFVISEMTEFVYPEIKNKYIGFKFMHIKSLFDKIPLYFYRHNSWIHKSTFAKKLYLMGDFLAYTHRICKLTFTLWKTRPDRCIFSTVLSTPSIEIPLLFIISFFSPPNIHYFFTYHVIADLSRTGSVRVIYKTILMWLYRSLKNGRRVTILSHSVGISRFFQSLGFETKVIPYAVEQYENFRIYPKVKAKELLTLPLDTPTFLSFGPLTAADRNIHNLIEAIDALPAKCTIVIASQPINSEYYKALLKKLNTVKNKKSLYMQMV